MNPGHRLAGRYVIEAQAGSGGMGTVYKAHDRDGRPVAVKIMLHGSTDLGERFTREAQLLMALEHPAIVQCLDTGITEDGRRFMVMEWLDGVELGAYVEKHRLSVRDGLALIGRIAGALGTVHELGVVHRDVKPANVFLPNSDINNAKLLDFGIAYWSAAARLTVSGTQMGTPSYMAPEQIRGDDVDARTDVFSLGCVLYLCLSGEPAYSGHHLQDVFCKILMEEPPRIARIVRGLPQAVLALVDAMMAKDPNSRPDNATDIAGRIAWIQENVALSDAPPDIVGGVDRSSAVTRNEQRLVSVVAVVARTTQETAILGVHDPAAVRPVPMPDMLLQRYESLGARFEHLARGVFVGIFDTRAAATDQADDAARCALDLYQSDPARDIVVATGRVDVTRPRGFGEVFDRVDELLGVAGVDALGALRTVCAVRVCEVTAGLIEQRFETNRDERGHVLVRERYLPGRIRLLGNHMPFVGRAREIALLQTTLAECMEESMARAVLITGPMGIGKSRLAQQFSEFVADHDAEIEVVQASGDPMRTGSPLELLAQLIRGLAGIQEGESEAVRRDKLATRVRATMPPESADRVAMFLGELIRTPWPDDDNVQLRASRRDPQLMGEQIRRASQELLLAETKRHPVLLLLENLHWSDQATVTWVGSLLHTLRRRPLLVVAVGRHQLHEQCPDIWSKHDLLELRLRGLSPRNAETLVRSVSTASLTEPQVAELIQRADGNPLYLEELIRNVAAERTQLPDTVLAMMHVRLQKIPDMPRRALRAASIVGDQFWSGCIATLCGREVDVERELRWLTDEEFLVESRSSKFVGETEFRFRHDLIREAAYGMLTANDRRLAHRLTGQWLQQVGETDALVVAQHFERGSAPDRARPLLLQAAVSACRTGDLEAAEAIAARGASLSLGADDEIHGALRAIQVDRRGQIPAGALVTRAIPAQAASVRDPGSSQCARGPTNGRAGRLEARRVHRRDQQYARCADTRGSGHAVHR